MTKHKMLHHATIFVGNNSRTRWPNMGINPMAAVASRLKDRRILAKAPDVQPEWLTADQLCQHLQISRHTLRAAAEAGHVEVMRLGRKTVRYRPLGAE